MGNECRLQIVSLQGSKHVGGSGRGLKSLQRLTYGGFRVSPRVFSVFLNILVLMHAFLIGHFPEVPSQGLAQALV